jgi:hypothetical protein
VKTTLFAATLVVALTLSAAAAQKPAVSQHLAGSTEPIKLAGPGIPPALCNPCLFYGGDLNPADANAAGLSDENTLLIVGGSSTYGSFTATGVSATVTGILFNVQASTNFDPATASYDVRTGVSDGNGGNSVASGTASIAVAATGRNFIGLNEYTVAVHIPALTLTAGVEYWFNVTPQCTNGATDGSCYEGRIFASNTTQETNNVRGSAQSPHSMYLNSSFFGFTFANWCDSSLGLNSNQCLGLSYGLIGSEN